MGAAKDDLTCASIVWNQVSSVGQLALTIATVGTSLIPATAANTAADVGRVAQLKAIYADLKAAYDAAKSASPALQAAERAYNVGSTALKVTTVADSAANIVTEEDILRLAAQIAAIVNSTGVSAVTSNFTYSKCSKLFPDAAPTSGISVVSATYGLNCKANYGVAKDNVLPEVSVKCNDRTSCTYANYTDFADQVGDPAFNCPKNLTFNTHARVHRR